MVTELYNIFYKRYHIWALFGFIILGITYEYYITIKTCLFWGKSLCNTGACQQ